MRDLRVALRGEAAVAITFVVNGAVFASLLPRLPQIKEQLGLGNAAFGLALLGTGLGGLIGSALAPRVLERAPRGRTVALAGVLLAVAGIGPPIVASVPGSAVAPALLLGTVLFVIGLLDAVHDVSMNVVALALQRQRGASIMGRLHATWSAGAVVAGAVGALAAARGVPVVAHIAVAVAVAAAAQMLVARDLPDPTRAPPTEPTSRRRLVGIWATMGAVAIAAGISEGPSLEWSAIYLREGLGTGPGIAGAAPVTFTAAMLVSRVLVDRVIDRWGAPAVATGSGVLVVVGAVAGLWISSVTGWPGAALAGFALTGAGSAAVFPLMFVAGERMPAARNGAGAGAVSFMARIGFLIASPVIGASSEVVGLAWALMIIAVGGAVIAVTLPARLR